MTLMEAIDRRVSCRAYRDEPIDGDVFAALGAIVGDIRARSELNVQLYGPREGGRAALDLNAAMFAGPVYCYAALTAPDTPEGGDAVGYWGEELALRATQMGLGTCWVGGTFDRHTTRVELAEGERLWDVMPIGWPMEKTPVRQRMIRAGLRARDRKPAQLIDADAPLAELPGWFIAAVEAVIKGPSAVNAQPVRLTWRNGGTITIGLAGSRIDLAYNDLGIARRHFEIAAAANGVAGRWSDGPVRTFLY